MRSILGYSVIAVALGLAFILVPMLGFSEIKQQYIKTADSPMSNFLEADGEQLQKTTVSASEVEFCAVCFAVALIAYLFVRGRIPRRKQNWIGPFLY